MGKRERLLNSIFFVEIYIEGMEKNYTELTEITFSV